MNKIVQEFDDVLEKKVEVSEIKREAGKLAKMLKIGFEAKPVSMERVSKVYASNDNKKISKFYDQMASWINGVKLSGNFDQFKTYMSVTYGITIDVSETSIMYNTNKKKFGKFTDLYTEFFLEEPDLNPSVSIGKILRSIENLTREANGITDEVKELLQNVIDSQTDLAPETVKTIDRILTKARIKEVEVEAAAEDIESKIALQQQAIDLLGE